MPRDPSWLYVESVRSVLVVLAVFVVQVVKWYEARRGEARRRVRWLLLEFHPSFGGELEVPEAP